MSSAIVGASSLNPTLQLHGGRSAYPPVDKVAEGDSRFCRNDAIHVHGPMASVHIPPSNSNAAAARGLVAEVVRAGGPAHGLHMKRVRRQRRRIGQVSADERAKQNRAFCPLAMPTLRMLETEIIRELFVDDAAGSNAGCSHLSAASGLVRLGNRLFVVADDENHLATFERADSEPGRLVRMFDGQLPQRHKARKTAKPDCEALLVLPAFAGYPHGALIAMGSGSRPSRQRAALLALDPAAQTQGPARTVDLAPLLAPLHELIPDLNIEGAFVQGDAFALLQRGNSGSAINARIDLSWHDVQRWLAGAGPAPKPAAITRFALGAIDGIALSFTDATPLPGGEWLFSAAAEDTSDTYNDGRCAGSAIGLIDAAGTMRSLERLSLVCKVEGIAAVVAGSTVELLMVTDADDRRQPARLLGATWRR